MRFPACNHLFLNNYPAFLRFYNRLGLTLQKCKPEFCSLTGAFCASKIPFLSITIRRSPGGNMPSVNTAALSERMGRPFFPFVTQIGMEMSTSILCQTDFLCYYDHVRVSSMEATHLSYDSLLKDENLLLAALHAAALRIVWSDVLGGFAAGPRFAVRIKPFRVLCGMSIRKGEKRKWETEAEESFAARFPPLCC